MPPKPTSDTIYSTAYHDEVQVIPFLYSQLHELYHWQNIQLNGDAANDSVSTLAISEAIKTMRADTIPNCGIRVKLTSQVKYKVLVRLIDLMNINNQRKYLFDIYHGPFALYVLVDEYTPKMASKDEPRILCGTMYTQMPTDYQPAAIGYWSVSYFTRFGNWLAALWNPSLKESSWYTSAVGTGTEYDITLRLEKQYLPQFLRSVPHRLFALSCSGWRVQFLLIIGMAVISWWKLKRYLQA